MNKRKEFTGIVISDKMLKTRIVRVTRLAKHPKYHKIMKKHNKYKVHDEKNVTRMGDCVRIVETRPISKDKRFRILRIIKSAAIAEIAIKEA